MEMSTYTVVTEDDDGTRHKFMTDFFLYFFLYFVNFRWFEVTYSTSFL